MLFGIESYKIIEDDRRVEQIGKSRKLFYVFVGLYGILIGILAVASLNAPVIDYMAIPLMYSTLLVPSILGLVQWKLSKG